ncbi:MAG: chromosome segregation protein SMC [Eubacteriales bacterium]|nr:chromosome segregation protein SMC [Eubacteriales bacterium]
MYLKSIEINGFKSFANKIVFEFPHGITGIVGPNGSGKSNIGDAVRWVLGEQSAKQLRGSRMEDVIFSGTESRKPLGFAYVAITFENKDRKIALDFDEIKVARRVYRSGESEYLINGAICRRRQIVELFYDTGIGKEGYSIIGQGQVEKILSGRLEDSRELFDEAAGIAKFKKDRNTTEKALEKSRADLERVTDILRELEKQVGPLEQQSEKAKKFLLLHDKEKEIDIQLFVRDYEKAEEEKIRTESNLAITKKQLEDTRVKYDAAKEKNAAILKKAEEYGKQADEEENKLNDLREQNISIDRKMVDLHHEIDKNHLLNEQYLSNIQQAEEEISSRKEQIKEEEKLIHAEEAVLLDCEGALTILDVDRQKVSDQLSALEEKKNAQQEKMLSMITSNSDLKEKLSRVETLEEQLNIRNAEYNSRHLMLRSELSEYQKKAEELRDELEITKEKNALLRADYDAALLANKKLEENIASLRGQMDQYNQDFLKNRSKYETLSNLSERYEGYQRSIQHVMEQKKHNPEIIGVVADILTMDQKYEVAIEIALGGALQNIVTENEVVAKKMIQYLKKNRFGRATFLPLTSIRKRNMALNPAIFEEEGVIGVASSLVTADQRYHNLVESLLGRTIVTENVDHALYLSRKYNFSLRIVTIDGELLNPGGSITGGAFRNNSNLLGRNREIEDCKEAMKIARNRYKETKEELSKVEEEAKESAGYIISCKEKYDSNSFRLSDLNHQIPEMNEKEKELNLRIDQLKMEHQILKKQLEEISEQKRSLSKNQMDDTQVSEENQDVIDVLDQQLQEVSVKAEELQEEYNQLLVKESQAKQKIEFSRQTMKRLLEEITSFEETIAEMKGMQNQILLENHNHEAELSKEKIAMDALLSQISDLEQSLDALKQARNHITEELNVSYKVLEEENEQLRLLEREESRLSNRFENLEHELENLGNYMWENYELTFNYALTLKKEGISAQEIEEWRKEKKELRQKIKALGNVNLSAIEEFKEVGERYSFMKEQYDDIKESEEKLLSLIEEFNRQMKAQFEEKFKDIREMFEKVFKNLFEGGQASLELMDESNILECGIRIIAQPPGKKLQNIMLLSGGERALTAIALLFAIQNLKPSPFCLLDEIEAALDDANIIRFSKYLKALSKDTQFIVITHRRGTMNASDVLYGITMQEKGISTLISVDLIDKDLK